MSEVILSIENLSKYYGKIKAVNQLSLDINQGNIFGILGPNGSGKTTLLGIVLDVINPTAGLFKWFGKEPSKDDRKRIGAILETPNFYPYLSAIKNLEIVAKIKGVSYDEIPKVLEIVELSSRKKSKFKTYSLGMKQRLAIAAALMGNPEVLILDEPTNGLDPQGIAEIRNIVKEIAKKGITIIIASHLLDEVQKICTHVVVLEKGQKLFAGKVSDVLLESTEIEVQATDMKKLNLALEKYKKATQITEEDGMLLVSIDKDTDTTDLNKYLFDQGVMVSHISIRKKSLENYFLELLAESNDKTA